MSEYTAEDFKNAKFAEHRHGAKAVRWGMNYHVPWHTVIGDRFSDEQMAESGWRPVREHNPRQMHALEEMVGDLRDGLVDLQRERDRLAQSLRRSYGHPKGGNAITLDALEAAWEAAEEVTECRKGDVLIERYPNRSWHVYQAESVLSVCRDVRILSRAPRREPWEDLGEKLAVEMPRIEDEPRIEALAKALYREHGVRVTGGDDDE